MLCDLNAHIHFFSVIAKSVTLWQQIYGLTFELSAVNGGVVGEKLHAMRPPDTASVSILSHIIG